MVMLSFKSTAQILIKIAIPWIVCSKIADSPHICWSFNNTRASSLTKQSALRGLVGSGRPLLTGRNIFIETQYLEHTQVSK